MKNQLTVSEVNQNFSKARRAVMNGPLVITDHGVPALVLMRFEDFQPKTEPGEAFLRRLRFDGPDDVELVLPPREIEPFREIDFD
jgi:antitoxin (DNA-binding transcriptional repressor) of toxin-antitoxin stability system